MKNEMKIELPKYPSIFPNEKMVYLMARHIKRILTAGKSANN